MPVIALVAPGPEVTKATPTLPLRRIVQGKNPREYFDPIEMADLDAGLRAAGRVVQAIIVRPIPGTDLFEIVAGERRWRAAKNVFGDDYDMPVVIEALVPKSGATLFFDTMAIPKDAPNVANAHLFINYILRPEVHASLTNKVFYANPNAASLKFVKKEVAENKTIFLDAAATKTMVAPDTLPQDLRRVQTRTFSSFKAAK